MNLINIIDAVIFLGLLLGAVIGFKKGVIQSGVTFVGTILVIFLAWMLKNPLSSLMYNSLPFFTFSGDLAGVTVLNILIYEAIAFLIVFAVLMALLRAIILFTGIIEKVLKFTIVLGIPSKILGAILGAVEAFILIFILLFTFSQFNFSQEVLRDSKYTHKILNKTPFLSSTVSDGFEAIEEIYSLKTGYDNKVNNDQYNLDALDILLKREIIKPSAARKLVEKGKIPQAGAIQVIEKYE